MKKFLVFLFIAIFMVSFATAFSFDNFKYEKTTTWDGKDVSGNKLLEEYSPIQIKNAFGLGKTIFEGYLSEHDNSCGTDCSSIIEINLGEERPLIDDVYFKTLQEDGTWIRQDIRSYQFYIETGEDSWVPYNVGDTMPKGTYTLKLEAKKKPSRTVDWIIKTSGETLSEWATWKSSLLVDKIVTYLPFNETAGAVIDMTGNFTPTNNGATRGVPGIISNGFAFAGAESVDLAEFNTPFEITACVWMNFTNVNTGNRIMGKWGSGTASWLMKFDGSSKIQWLINDPSLGTISTTSTGSYNDGAFHQVCGVANSTHPVLYIDNDTEVIVGSTYTGLDGNNTGQTINIGGTAGEFYTGDLDEFVVFNRSSTQAQISELWNGGVANMYPFNEGSVVLVSPDNNSVTGDAEINFTCFASVTSGTLVNMTLYTNETGDWTAFNETTGLSTAANSASWNRTYSGSQNILWNCRACDSDDACGFAEFNRSAIVDVSLPTIDIESPNGTLDFGLIGGNQSLNVTFTDTALDTCWYDYNNTNITIDGCVSGVKNSTNIILEFGNTDVIFYANDTIGNLNSSSTSWNYFLQENSQTFSSNTTEGSTETFSINITANETPASASFIYNGTITSADIDASNFPIVIISEAITTPSVDAVTNFTFLWNVVSASSDVNSSSQNQTVNNLALDNCSSFTNVLFNYTMVDEATQTQLAAGPSDNVSLEVEVTIYNADKSTLILNFSTSFSETNPNAICSGTDLFNGTTFVLDSTAKYTSDPREIEYYNIRDATIDNTSATQNITLYDILTTESTDFQITFKNSDFIVVEGALIQVNRQFVSEGVFKTVELPITDSNGQTIVHLVRNDVVYNYIVTKDNEVIGTFNNLIAFCEDQTIGQCFISLNALQGTTNTFNVDQDIGISSSFAFNSTSRDLVLTFATTDGTVRTVLLNGTKMDQIGNTSICSASVTSSSGTLTCNIPASIGNETIIANVFVDGELKLVEYFSAAPELELGQGGYFLLLFLVISLGLMFSESKSMMIGGIILGFIGGMLFFFIKGGIVGTGGAIAWLIVQGVILLWKLNSEGQT